MKGFAERGKVTTLKDWLRGRVVSFSQDLSTISDRVRSGEEFHYAVREFLDEFQIRPEQSRSAAIERRPDLTGDVRFDAYLGALAEHLAAKHGLATPRWATEAERFLDRFWFVSDVKGFRALAIAQSPAAFRRRGIFISSGSLERV